VDGPLVAGTARSTHNVELTTTHLWYLVTTIFDDGRVHEVFVKMIGVFRHSVTYVRHVTVMSSHTLNFPTCAM